MKVANKKMVSGRARQKQRTRKAILEAAARLLANGGPVPTIDSIADEAMVSRATLYRYFPNLDILLAEVPLDARAQAPAELFADLPNSWPPDSAIASRQAGERLERVQRHLHGLVRDQETLFRVFLRGTMDRMLDHLGRDPGPTPDPSRKPDAAAPATEPRPRVRQARRLEMIAEALAPVRDHLTAGESERLACALSMLVGIESFVALTDVCGLDPATSDDIGAWAVRTLLTGALATTDRRQDKPGHPDKTKVDRFADP